MLAAIAAALLSMAVYMKRGVSGNLRVSADSVGEPYHPRHSSSNITQAFSSDTTTVSVLQPDQGLEGGITADVMLTLTISGDTASRQGEEEVGALTGDLWD